jgi:YesN/AraC family two-component response regulator
MLTETTLLLVSKITDMDSQLEREIERILRQMKRAESTDGIIECMTVTVEKLCSYVNTRNDSNHQRLIVRITKFLDDNYNDPNLSLSSIAQSIHLTESYISSFFKQNKGINIQNYIEQKRMIKAVEMLKGTNLTTAEIVKMVGYYNINTFYKAFKRNFSMTPKECREGAK